MQILHDNILVRILKKEKDMSGIILTQDDENSLHFAEVVEFGNYVDNIEIGNIVCFPKLIARKFKYNGENLALVTENDVILVYKDREEAGV